MAEQPQLITTTVTKEDRVLQKIEWMANYDTFTAITFKTDDLILQVKSL